MKKSLLFSITFLWSVHVLAQPGNGFICQEAVCLSDNLGVTLNNENAPPSPPLSFSCGVTHNNLFYAFCPETGSVVLNITPANCVLGLGVQAIIYQTDDCSDYAELECVSRGDTDPFTITFSGTPGETYILMIDGFSNDVCDFTVTGTGIADIGEPPNEPILDPDDDPIIICEGEQLDIQIENEDQECTAYFWEVQSGLGFITLDENGSMATINAISEGFAVLCVKADNFSYETKYCIDVEVAPPPTLEPIPDVLTCEEQIDFCTYEFFFDPPLEPDPFLEGWDIGFHMTLSDADRGVNEIQCPYDLQGQKNNTIYIRVATGADCYSVQPFNIIFQEPMMKKIKIDPLCVPSEIRLSDLIQPVDSFGMDYSSVSFHDDPIDAMDGRSPFSDTEFTITDSLHLWVRAETDLACYDVQKVIIDTITNQIELEDIHQEKQLGRFIVDLDLNGPDTPYVIEWSDGGLGAKRHELLDGFFSVTITDTNGCQSVHSLWTYSNPFEDGLGGAATQLAPNPASAGSNVRILGNTDWEYACLYKSNGGFSRDYTLTASQRFDLPNDIPTGTYFLTLENGMGIKTLLLMVW